MMSNIRLYWLNSVTRWPRAFSLASSRSNTPILPAASTMSSPAPMRVTLMSCLHASRILSMHNSDTVYKTALSASTAEAKCLQRSQNVCAYRMDSWRQPLLPDLMGLKVMSSSKTSESVR